MEKLGRGIVKARIPILVISILLLIPAALGYINTRVNYDILYYLPKEIDTMQGQDILLDEFQKGAYAIVVVDGMHGRELTKLEDKIENVDHVAKLISYNSIVGGDIPLEMIPEKLRSQFYNSDKDSTMLAIFFDDTTSSDGTMNAIKEIRKVTDGQCFISGMSAVVTDTKTLSEKETPIYVLIAVILACIVLALFMDSFLVPVFFMLSIGIAIVYNLGSNYFMGEVSYITKALAAVLQLGVTLDYSIFLWHSYKEMKEEYGDDHKEAMAHAIASTITSVVGSSITTVAGFIALCFMSFTLGMDLGVVMAKGVVFGVICCVTVLPALILTFDKALEKTMHREILPARFDKLAGFIVNHAWIFIVIFVALLGPAIYGYQHTNVYYDLADTLPANLDCSIANKKLEENFDVNSIYMILADSELSSKDANKMMTEIKDLDGVTFALGLDSAIGNEIPKELIPESLKSELVSDTDGVASAADGVAALDAGANQLSSGINALSDTFKSQILTGVAQLADGADALVGGIQNQLIPGANTLSAGIDKLSVTLNGSFSQIKSNADTYGVKYQTALTSAKTLETAATTTLPNGATLNDILTQVGQLAGGVDMTIKTATDLSGDLTDESKVTALFTKYITAYTAAVKLDTLSEYNTSIKTQLDTVNGTISQITGGAYTKLDSLYTAEMGLLLQAVSNGGVYTALNTVYNTATQTVDPETGYNLSQSLKALSNGAKQLIGGLGQIKDGAGQISLGAKKLKMGIGSFDELNPAAETVCSALYKIQAGGSQLTGGTKQLGDGLSTLKSNNETLNSGASALKAGTSQLRSASATLADGVDQLAEGSITLKDGMIEFNETGVQKLANLVKNDAQDAVDTIKKIVELGNDYQSFAGKSDDVKGTVKFIYKTEGITK